jgi:predicted P-loop ATPase
MNLTPDHRQHLASEGFTDMQITELVERYGVRSLSQSDALEQGFKAWDGQKWLASSGIRFPFTKEFAQERLDTPLNRHKGKPARYLTPVGKSSQALLPDGCEVVTEGFKDAMAGSLHGGISTGAIAGVSHYRKALPQGCGYTIVFDSDGWTNPQVFANLIHAGKWCNGRVVLLPEIGGQPHAGLCEYFKAGHTAEDYRALLDSAQRPEDLLQEWPEHWNGTPPHKLVHLAKISACLAVLYLSVEECNAFIRRVADRHQGAGLRARELAAFAKKWRDRRQKTQNLTTYQREYRLITNKFGRRLAFNELTLQPELDGVAFRAEKVKAVLSLDHGLPLKSSREDLIDSVLKIAQIKSYHPIREYLDRVWKHRNPKIKLSNYLEKLAKRYFGNTDPTAQVLLKKTLIAAVARAFNPGCKLDTATVLAGPQGYGKSQFWKTLASPDWFCDDFNDVDNKDHLLKLHEAWIIEWPELHGLNRKESNRVKSFMTTARDRIRRPYGREAEWMARPSMLVGTSNDKEFLTDSTGNRRWWIIEVTKKVDTRRLEAERDLIWAAAVALYKAGEPWWLSEIEEMAADTTRKQYEAVDAWHDAIAGYLEDREVVSIAELFQKVLIIEVGRQDNASRSRIASILRRCGWDKAPTARSHNGTKCKVWQKQEKIIRLLPQKNRVPGVPGFHEAKNPDAANNTAQAPNGTPPNNPGFWGSGEDNDGTSKNASGVPVGVPVKTIAEKGIQPLRNLGTLEPYFSQSAQNEIFSPGDQVGKKGKSGWVGTVQSDPQNGWVNVLWAGDKAASSVKIDDLRAIA